eukprot:gene7622-9126_t
MSTIEKILLSLQENCNGKKEKLTNSYQERSVWLRNEFDVIRNLIKQNPREHMANQKEPELASVEPTASSSSSVAREQSGDGRKRKSPETVNAVKLSPQQKRSSIDVDDLVSQAGLPSDLNKLKKEQLLVELEKRGNTHFSMKNTKNVLIDGLRDTLLSEHQSRDEAPEQPILQNASVDQKESGDSTDGSSVSGSSSVAANESESTSMVLSTPSKPASVRKGSLMADFRSLVQNNNAQAGSTAANGASEGTSTTSSKRIEDEYQARMNRQRESIAARKSVLGEAQVALTAASAAAAPVSTAAPFPEPPVVSAVLAPPAAPEKEEAAAPAPTPVLSLAVPLPVKAGDSKDSIGSTASAASAASGDNIWMEVSSPVRTSSAPAAQEDEEKTTVIAAPESSHMRPRTESDASFQSCASTGSSVSKASTSSKSGATTASSTSNSSVRPISSKASSYNTEKPAVAKSVAPTLMKAKLGLKPVDEPRTAAPSAMLKKKDNIPENKPLGSKPVSAAASAQPARPVTAAPAPVQAAAAPSTAAASADTAATANAAPVKRGIFGFLSNSKKNITSAPVAGPTTTTNSAAPVAPSALSSSGGSLFSPSAQSSARSAAPAMVDSIIKSAKMDSAHAAAPTPVSAPIQKASPSEQPLSDAAKGPLGGSGGKIAGTPGAPLNNAFASKSLISNIVNNYNNAVKSTPAPVVVASTPAAVKPAAAPAGTSVLRDITPAAGNAPASAVKAAPAAVPATPSAAAAPVAAASAVNEYIIEDRDDSDEEGSGTDGEKEEGEGTKPKQNVPDWARGPLLKEALERQYGMGGQVPVDPDLIFPEVTTCSLEEIFGAREGLSRKYANRSSSAHWDADQMTLVEKRVYRKHMGYDRGQQQTGATPLGAK